MNKRVETSGILMAELFRTLYKRMLRTIEPQLCKRPNILCILSKVNLITQGIKHCFSTGNWGIPKSSYIRTGVSQVMNRMTYNSFLSQLNRVLIPIGKEGKNTKIRQLHPSQIGFFCAHETPEGHCLSGDTCIEMDNGYTVRLEDLSSYKTTKIPTLSSLQRSDIQETYFQGPTRVLSSVIYTFTLSCGRTLRCTSMHRLLTRNRFSQRREWKYAQDLRKNQDEIMTSVCSVYRTWKNPCSEKMLRYSRILGFLWDNPRVWKHSSIGFRQMIVWIPTDLRMESFFCDLEFLGWKWKWILYPCHGAVIVPQKEAWTLDNSFWENHIQKERVLLQEFYHGWFSYLLLMSLSSHQGEEDEIFSIHDENVSVLRQHQKNLRLLTLRFDIQFDSVSQKNRLFSHRDELFSKGVFSFVYLKMLHNTFLPQQIQSIEVSYTDHPVPMYDICLPESPTKSFLANGIVVHNSAGIVKNLALSTLITTRTDSIFLRSILESMVELEKIHYEKPYRVFFNGIWIGCLDSVDPFRSKLYEMRQQRIIPDTVSISLRYGNELHVFSDEGRMIRPFFRVSFLLQPNESSSSSFSELIQKGHIVYRDIHELEELVIAMTPEEVFSNPTQYDLCEIHPSLLLGLSVGLIPYSDHTQAPRITYHASMGKQSISHSVTNLGLRADTSFHHIEYAERPIVNTHLTFCEKMVTGTNVVVAILMYTGFNQEDSIILNQSSIDRGLFRSFQYKTIHIEEKKKSTMTSEVIQDVPMSLRNRSFNYSKLNTDGIVRVGSYVGPNDVIVSKLQLRSVKNGTDEKTDGSVVIKSGEEGTVDRIFLTTSPDGYRILKIKIRQQKIPEIGDKMCSRSAQKGTIGMTLPQEDMPFTADGIVPDIIINPLCIPSRMTINQLIECLGAKSAIEKGIFRNGTPFTSDSHDVIPRLSEALKSCGYQPHGLETMYNGCTGEMLESMVFIGPTYYQRLKHLVSNKIHARNNGSVQALTRQPLEGRSRDGGLRFGEMERDALRWDTEISLTCGVSIRIDQMKKKGWSVLSWSETENGIVPSRQVEILDKGMRDCYEMILEDGRTLYPSIRHPFLTHENKWIRADEIVVNETILKTSLQFPCMDLQKEMELCQRWTFLRYKTDTVENYLDTLAFVRILGLLITDGHLSRKEGGRSILGGHLLDRQAYVEDIQRFCPGFVPSSSRSSSQCILPDDVKDFSLKMTKELILPDFILDENCPLPILREFLGAMFGGNGRRLRGKRDTLVSFSRSSSLLPNLKSFFDQLIRLLNRFGLTKITILQKANTNSNKQQTQEKRTYSFVLQLDREELLPFSEKIGFRYCFHQSQRLQAAICYYRLRFHVKRQHDWIVRRVDEITNFSQIKKEHPTKIVGTKKAIEQAVHELQQREPLLHPYAIPSTHDITDHLIKGTQFGKYRSDAFPTVEQYMQQIGALDWFVSDDHFRSLQTVNLRVLALRPIGEHRVYDIQVDRTESFLAEGVVAHNCMISHGVSRFLNERLFDMSDKFSVPICIHCGIMPHSETECMMCKKTDVRRVALPYACKLLFQQLMTMGIKIHLHPALKN